VRAPVLGLELRERGAQGADGVVGAVAASVEPGFEQVELLAQRADADAEDESSAGDAVERAVALGDRQRVVVADDEHMRGEPDGGGASGDVAECRQRVPVGGPACVDHGAGERDVLAAREVVEAEPLGLDGDAGELLDARRLLPRRVRPRKARDCGCDDAELHGSTTSTYLRGRRARSAMMFFCTSVAPAPIVV
jgi:hypothetical protein